MGTGIKSAIVGLCATGGYKCAGTGWQKCPCSCVCADVVAGLPSSVRLDYGAWDMSDCPPPPEDCEGDDPCAGITQPFIELPQSNPNDCEFSLTGITPGDICLGGMALFNVVVGLDCDQWTISFEFYIRCSAEVGGPSYHYEQRVPDCADPTGIYDLITPDPTECGTPPATITVS